VPRARLRELHRATPPRSQVPPILALRVPGSTGLGACSTSSP
jgi:hypothetical protein